MGDLILKFNYLERKLFPKVSNKIKPRSPNRAPVIAHDDSTTVLAPKCLLTTMRILCKLDFYGFMSAWQKSQDWSI
jgi:hypothetical protein